MAKRKPVKRHSIDLNGWEAHYEELRLNVLSMMRKKLRGNRDSVPTKS